MPETSDVMARQPRTAAGRGPFTTGVTSISCEPWDIGTGVAGYAWQAPEPKAALLLQHGYGDHVQRYVRQNGRLIPHLLRLGVSVYAFDMRGSGHSPGVRGATDVHKAIEDHCAARRTLREQPLRVFLFGHSLGGLVTVTSVLRDQTGVSGMILVSPAIKYDVNGFLRLVARIGGLVAPTLSGPIPVGSPDALSHDPEAVEAIRHDPLLYLGRVKWRTLGSAAPIIHENWKLYPRVRVPVLVVHGSADRIANPEGSRQFIETVSSPDKTLHLVEDGLHALLDDTGRQQTRQVILEWLQARISR